MTRHRQTDPELMQHLYEQMAFLRRSAAHYDDGEFSEAKRLAATLRVLLHDTQKSLSLLTQLGIKKKLRFIDTAGDVAPNTFERLLGDRFRAGISIGMPLAPVTWGDWGFAFIARLDDHRTRYRPRRFEKWWNNNVVVSLPSNFRLTRRELVLGVSNQDGGAHIDASLKEQFAGIARQRFIRGPKDKPLSIATIQRPERKGPANPTLPMIRQIAYEVTKTLEGRIENLP